MPPFLLCVARHAITSAVLLVGLSGAAPVSARDALVLDDRSSANLCAANGACWRAVSDTVMGGLSDARLQPALIDGRPCLRLSGEVSLLNNGGFMQASLDLDQHGVLDASAYSGVEIEVWGNNESYNLHLRSSDTRVVWQSYRASFQARPRWQILRLPFAEFVPHRIEVPLDVSRLRRIALVAIGREMRAEVCVARLSFYP